MVFLCAFFLAAGVALLVNRSTVSESLYKARQGRVPKAGGLRKTLSDFGSLISRLPVVKDYFNPKEFEKKLSIAGIRLSPAEFIGIQAASAAAGIFLGSMLRQTWFFSLSAVLLGVVLPGAFLTRRLRENNQIVERDFMLFLEKIAQGVTAGRTFEKAAGRAAFGLAPYLRKEAGIMVEDITAGKPPETAVTAFAGRLDFQEADDFARSVRNGLRHGDEDLSARLVELARDIRNNRDQRSEETAKKLEYQLLVPAVFFLMPTVFLLVGGPIMIMLGQTFR